MSNPTPEKKTVMICDDERDLLQLFGQALRSKYNVILASFGEDCIKRFA
jgi:response regulator RpfG family c-di-GMP phosphodiesterase